LLKHQEKDDITSISLNLNVRLEKYLEIFEPPHDPLGKMKACADHLGDPIMSASWGAVIYATPFEPPNEKSTLLLAPNQSQDALLHQLRL
jgi:hypothetical protein